MRIPCSAVAFACAVVVENSGKRLPRINVARDFQTSDNPASPELFVERDGELARLQ